MSGVKPGIYPRGQIDYEAVDAVNQSTLKAISRSPLHYRWRLGHDTEPSKEMRLGDVAHCALLEPHELARRYAVWAPVDEETGELKKPDFRGKKYEQFELAAKMQGKRVIKQPELDEAQDIATAVLENPYAARYLKRFMPEVVLVWIDPKTGLKCKARLDGISLSVGDVIIEVKTARDIGLRAFSSAYAKLEYDVQTAFYVDGLSTLTGRPAYAKCIAVENTKPHDVIVYDLAEVVDVGRDYYQEYLAKLVECRKADEWPGQAPDGERTLRLPVWRADPDGNELGGIGLELDG